MRLGFAALLLVPSTAHAALFGSSDGSPQVERRDTVLVFRAGEVAQVDTLILQGRIDRVVWFQPVEDEARPFEPAADLWERLQSESRPLRTHRDRIEARPLGPSILTRLFRSPREGTQVTRLAEPRPMRPVERALFRGQTTTSTLSGRLEVLLPLPMEAFLDRHAVKVGDPTRRLLAFHMGAGRSVIASVWQAEPDAVLHRLGPIGSYLDRPMLTVDLPDPQQTDRLIALADQVWAPRGEDLEVPDKPWKSEPIPPGAFRLLYARPPTDSLLEGLDARVRPAAARPVLFRIEWKPRGDLMQRFVLEPRPGPPIPARLPGSAADVLLVLLLGLTPLFYAPESWFLLWIQSGIRDRTVPGRGWPFTRIWAFWAGLVCLYWLANLDGAGRWAAVFPGLLALGALFGPERPRARFIRANFNPPKR